MLQSQGNECSHFLVCLLMHLEWCHPCLVMSILAQAFYASRGRKPANHQCMPGETPLLHPCGHQCLPCLLWAVLGSPREQISLLLHCLWFLCCFHWDLLPMEVCRHQEFTFFSFLKVKSGRPRSVSTQRRDILRGVTGWYLLTSQCVREASLPSPTCCHEMGWPSLFCVTFLAWLTLPLTFHISV